jgi:hypothetical protein
MLLNSIYSSGSVGAVEGNVDAHEMNGDLLDVISKQR